MKIRHLLSFLLVCISFLYAGGQSDSLAIVASPIPLPEYTLTAERGRLVFSSETEDGLARLTINGAEQNLPFSDGRAYLDREASPAGELLLINNPSERSYRLFHLSTNNEGTPRLRRIPMWLSVAPPLIAIFLALIAKEVVVSLFVGVWTGAFIAGGMRIDSPYYFLLSFWQAVERYVIQALNDSGHLAVIVFSILIGGMVAIISRNGGMAGIVQALSRYARSPRSAQFITWLLGVAIFFDDYANTLIVGNTMRSVTDRFRVSREKLAYIVDSTAAPVSAVAFITTWIGAELGYIDDGIRLLEGFDTGLTPYGIFLASLKYSFYPVFTLIFILMLVYTRRDYGPMHQAEFRARHKGQVYRQPTEAAVNSEVEDLDPVPGAPLKWYNAFIPVALVILMTIFGLIDSGMAACYGRLLETGTPPASQSWGDTWAALGGLTADRPSFFMKIGVLIGSADSYVALLWASLTGTAAAILLTIGGRIMRLNDTIGTMVTGFKTMLPALLILTLAWSLAATTEELHTAVYLTSALQGSINPYFMPPIVFVLAAAISFSTGSSWSTMAILYPIAIPTTWAICQSQGFDPDLSLELLLNVIATVLAASVLGDHCSPISDTTILSSLASDCHHIDHVRTQLPYALTVGAVSLIAGGLSTYLGGGWLISFLLLLIGLGVLFTVVWRLGKKVEDG